MMKRFREKNTQEILAPYELESMGLITQCLLYLLRPAIFHMYIPKINN